MSKNKAKEYFEDKYNVHRVEKCCGSCCYYKIDQDRDEYCDHPKVDECLNYNAYFIDAGHVCDLWEKETRY